MKKQKRERYQRSKVGQQVRSIQEQRRIDRFSAAAFDMTLVETSPAGSVRWDCGCWSDSPRQGCDHKRSA